MGACEWSAIVGELNTEKNIIKVQRHESSRFTVKQAYQEPFVSMAKPVTWSQESIKYQLTLRINFPLGPEIIRCTLTEQFLALTEENW